MASSHRIARRFLSSLANPLSSSRRSPAQLRTRIATRNASTSTNSPPTSRLKTAFYMTSIAVSGYVVYVYGTDTRAFVHRYVVPPLLRYLYPDAEEAHDVSVSSMKTLYNLGLHPRERSSSSISNGPDISVSVFGEQLANPIGISAGLDKHADIPDPLFALGASIVEVGGCTPRPQEGNPKPRMFRIPTLDGLINRYGLNSRGADDMAMRLRDRVRLYAKTVGLDEASVLNGEANVPPGSLLPGRLLLVQIAKNKETDERDVEAVKRDYVYCVQRLARYADVLVVNVSSPNTPGLRDLQAVEPLTRILSAVVDEARRTDRKRAPRVMVKVSPDEDEDTQMEGIAQAVWLSGVDGVIVGNTTKRRNGLVPAGVNISRKEQYTMTETGGYSGPMMFDRTVDLVRRYRKLLDGQSFQPAKTGKAFANEAVDESITGIEGTITGFSETEKKTSTNQPQEQKVIFATGGITNGRRALEILNAGASVAMIYTGLVYGGAGSVTRMKSEMKEELAAENKS
ncbi:Dihydroorotate dehydrogenase (quinone), mitochondrial [Daldinia childiae]|uniref:Dihydroorotate dehydrogenase (quinone), mitochondrial n=1 Tax=Daldinia childiae TaxID=326645 RepID=UPI001444D928|nr:Dihydroorotate dehydrogenase (quinone), mitochondrial [Daldinia childiae]KAF3062346.1 Dihydroorotate dehydrogenase (quinone), mitochondrial [Daldinia childiae]